MALWSRSFLFAFSTLWLRERILQVRVRMLFYGGGVKCLTWLLGRKIYKYTMLSIKTDQLYNLTRPIKMCCFPNLAFICGFLCVSYLSFIDLEYIVYTSIKIEYTKMKSIQFSLTDPTTRFNVVLSNHWIYKIPSLHLQNILSARRQ